MTCYSCEPNECRTIKKLNQTATPTTGFKEFKNRLTCSNCHSRFHDFIVDDGSEFIINHFDFEYYVSEDVKFSKFRGYKKSRYSSGNFHELIRSGWEINDTIFGGVGMFYEACIIDDIEKVNLLIELGLDIEKFGSDALHFACIFSSFKTYERFKQLGLQVEIDTVFKIIEEKKFKMFKRILDDGYDINSKNTYSGEFMIHAVAEAGSIKMVKMLVDHGADFNVTNNRKRTICHYACCSNNSLGMVKYLFESGFDFNIVDTLCRTPLLIAIENGNKSIAKYLIEQKAGINICDNEGNSILHHCARKGWDDCVDLLIKSGIDVNAKNLHWETALHLTRYCYFESKREKTINLLLDNGADVNILDNYNYSPLSYLCKRISEKLKQRFILIGANLGFNDQNGNCIYLSLKTALNHILKQVNDKEIKIKKYKK